MSSTETTSPGAIQQEQKPVEKAVSKDPQKLTVDEKNSLLRFIGKCVAKNAGLQGGNKFNVASRLTIQEIYNSSETTLIGVLKGFKKAILDDDPEFTGGQPLKISGIKAQEWFDNLKLLLKEKQYAEFAAKQRARIKDLEKSIEANLSPGEKRQKDEAELAALTAHIPAEEED